MKSSILFILYFVNLCECQSSLTTTRMNHQDIPQNAIQNNISDEQMNNEHYDSFHQLNEKKFRESVSLFTMNQQNNKSHASSQSPSPSSLQPTMYPSIPPNHHHHHHKHHTQRFIPKDVFQAFMITIAVASLIVIILACAVHRGRIVLYFSGLWFQWGCDHKMERIQSIFCFWSSSDDEADYDSEPPLNEVIFDYSDKSQIHESLLSD